MANREPWDYALERACQEEIEVLKENLAEGGGDPPSQYHYICGKIRGIRIAMEKVKEVQGRFQQEEETGWDEVVTS